MRLQIALEQLSTPTLQKIVSHATTEYNKGTWSDCVMDRLCGGSLGETSRPTLYASEKLLESVEAVSSFISAWDSFLGRTDELVYLCNLVLFTRGQGTEPEPMKITTVEILRTSGYTTKNSIGTLKPGERRVITKTVFESTIDYDTEAELICLIDEFQKVGG